MLSNKLGLAILRFSCPPASIELHHNSILFWTNFSFDLRYSPSLSLSSLFLTHSLPPSTTVRAYLSSTARM